VKVPTGSMQNTITIGDHLLVNKFIFAPAHVCFFYRNARSGPVTSLYLSIQVIPRIRSANKGPITFRLRLTM
jgi:signal peptidase I